MKKYNIGIDMGTSSVKVLLADFDGNVLGEVSESYEISQPKAGWKEINPELWFQAMKKAMHRLLDGIDASFIGGIGVTGQMHTTVFLDEQGSSIRPALLWNDVRTASIAAELKEKIINEKELISIAKIISTGSPAANLKWVKDYEPENFKRLKHFVIGPDYLVYRLTGNLGTDYCEASTSSLYQLEKNQWSEKMRELIGLPEEIYPEIHGSGIIMGNVLPELQKEFGFDEETRVIAGTGDNPAAAISTGCLIKKYPVLSLGTSGVLIMPRKEADFTSKGKNIKFSIDGKEIITMVQGVAQSVGSTIDWWMKKQLQVEDMQAVMQTVTESCEKKSLLFYPHLTGDKTIHADPKLRGAFLGLGTEHTRQDMIAAILEGICFAVKHILEEMKVPVEELDSLKVTGGGAKNAFWMQTLSDVLGMKVEQLDGKTGAALGMALLAGQSCGNIENLEELAERMIQIKGEFLPNAEKAEDYAKKYAKYKKIYEALKFMEE